MQRRTAVRTIAVLFAAHFAVSTPFAATTAPAADAPEVVGKLIAQLSADDPDIRDRATEGLQDLPYADLPQIKAAADGADLPPEASARLKRVLPLITQRAKLVERYLKAQQATAAFYESEAITEYDHGGHTDPKWDDAARACLRTNARRFPLIDPKANAAARTEARQQLATALAAGCDDPTLLTFSALLLHDDGEPDAAVTDLFNRAAQASSKGYPGPLFHLILDARMLRAFEKMKFDDRVKVWSKLDPYMVDMHKQLRRLIGIPGVPVNVAVDQAENCFDRFLGLNAKLETFMTRDLQPLEKKFPNDPAVLTLKGRAHIKWAWEARGSGWANTVTPQGWKDFAARLDVANTALTQAADADADDVEAPTLLITIGMGQSWDRAVMDKWYQRAQAANPDDARAANSMLTYLEPKWNGDADSMIKFGQACLAGGNFRSDVPKVLVDAYSRLAKYYVPDQNTIWLHPGVWEDLHAVYAGYLARRPDDVHNRNMVARFAVLCHQWKAADEQFKWLGDRADAANFGIGSPAALDEARKTAARLADKPDEQGK